MGFDINASLSGSSSATSGLHNLFGDFTGGDFLVGGASKQELPKWTIPALIAGLVVVAVIYLVRKH